MIEQDVFGVRTRRREDRLIDLQKYDEGDRRYGGMKQAGSLAALVYILMSACFNVLCERPTAHALAPRTASLTAACQICGSAAESRTPARRLVAVINTTTDQLVVVQS